MVGAIDEAGSNWTGLHLARKFTVFKIWEAIPLEFFLSPNIKEKEDFFIIPV